MNISGRLPAIKVEYDHRGERRQKAFNDAFVARRFYTAKFREGKHPKVIRVKEQDR